MADLRDGQKKTYGIQVFNQSIHDRLLHNWTRPDGCRDLILGCQEALKEHGPLVAKGVKTNATEVCWLFLEECGYSAAMLYQTIPDGKGWYDIGHDRNDPFPAPHMYGYLTEGEVLSSLGVPVNYSESSGAVGKGFGQTFGKTALLPSFTHTYTPNRVVASDERLCLDSLQIWSWAGSASRLDTSSTTESRST